ncbi:hypothetical protein L9F63_017618, partial [Diploptera punctata]
NDLTNTVLQRVDWKDISSYLGTSFARPRTPGLFCLGGSSSNRCTEPKGMLVHVFRAT